MSREENQIGKAAQLFYPRHMERGRKTKPGDTNIKIKVSGDLCHRSGYVQNGWVKKLSFSKSTSQMIRLAPGIYSLTVFVGAGSGRTNVDFTVELITNPDIELFLPGNNPIRAQTVGSTGFVVIDFTLS